MESQNCDCFVEYNLILAFRKSLILYGGLDKTHFLGHFAKYLWEMPIMKQLSELHFHPHIQYIHTDEIKSIDQFIMPVTEHAFEVLHKLEKKNSVLGDNKPCHCCKHSIVQSEKIQDKQVQFQGGALQCIKLMENISETIETFIQRQIKEQVSVSQLEKPILLLFIDRLDSSFFLNKQNHPYLQRLFNIPIIRIVTSMDNNQTQLALSNLLENTFAVQRWHYASVPNIFDKHAQTESIPQLSSQMEKDEKELNSEQSQSQTLTSQSDNSVISSAWMPFSIASPQYIKTFQSIIPEYSKTRQKKKQQQKQDEQSNSDEEQ